MKAAARAVMVAVLAALVILPLRPYWNAAAMILRAAGASGVLGRAAQWSARSVSDHVEQIATPAGRLRVRVFTPSGGARSAVLVVSGVHPAGIDEPRLIDLSRDLAGTGVTVVTPEIPDLMRYALTARVTDAIERAAEWLVRRDDLAGGRRVGLIGVSFSGGLSVVAAGRPALRNHVAYVLSLGGHGDLPRVLRFLCTGVEPPAPDAAPVHRAPHDYAVSVLLHQAAPLIVPPDQVAPLRSGIEVFLEASALARLDGDRAADVLKRSTEFADQLPEPSATLMRAVNGRNVSALGSRLLPYLPQLGQDPSLSPERSPSPAAPVYLLHGTGDNVIPAVESELLARHLAGRTRVRTLLSGFLSHVDVAHRPSIADTWRMIAFWTSALGES